MLDKAAPRHACEPIGCLAWSPISCAVKRSVGIAGGERKLAAIRGAARGGLINVLITDSLTAEGLITPYTV